MMTTNQFGRHGTPSHAAHSAAGRPSASHAPSAADGFFCGRSDIRLPPFSSYPYHTRKSVGFQHLNVFFRISEFAFGMDEMRFVYLDRE